MQEREMDQYNQFLERFKSWEIRVQKKIPLSAYSTLGVGGPATLLVEVQNNRQLAKAVRTALRYDIPFKIIGKGSNLIVADEGFDGLAIVNLAGEWRILDAPCSGGQPGPGEGSESEGAGKLPAAQSTEESVIVRVDSGVSLTSLMNSLYREGISGLQWFAGIPATVGGAIYMNLHGGSHFFAEVVQRARLLGADGVEQEVETDWFQFGYDQSRLQRSRDIVLWAELCLKQGDVQAARAYSKSWAAKKSFQPQRSAGCVFRNLTAGQQKLLNLPTPSVGYVIDRLLKLKGTRAGDAVISNKHAAFIENLGNATAKDVLMLVELIREKAKAELGIELQLEVEILKNN